MMIRALAALAALLTVASPCVAQTQMPVIQPGQIAAPLVAATIYVRDMNASLTLYRDELKMRVLSDQPSSAYGPGRTVTLGASDKMLGRIILVDLGSKGGTAPKPDRARYAHSGDFCVIIPIKAKDIWDFYNRYKNKYVFMSEGPVVLMANPNATTQSMGEMSFRDPDGVYVNIVSVS
jgi:catechol 2,3-dioxygenase-like lactoylglutathione lyase family enzyme